MPGFVILGQNTSSSPRYNKHPSKYSPTARAAIASSLPRTNQHRPELANTQHRLATKHSKYQLRPVPTQLNSSCRQSTLSCPTQSTPPAQCPPSLRAVACSPTTQHPFQPQPSHGRTLREVPLLLRPRLLVQGGDCQVRLQERQKVRPAFGPHRQKNGRHNHEWLFRRGPSWGNLRGSPNNRDYAHLLYIYVNASVLPINLSEAGS